MTTTNNTSTSITTNEFGGLIEITDATGERHLLDPCYVGNVTMPKADAFAVVKKWISSLPDGDAKVNELMSDFNEDNAAGVMLYFICQAVEEMPYQDALDALVKPVYLVCALLESNYWSAKVDRLHPVFHVEGAEMEILDAEEYKRRVEQAFAPVFA
ncbi:hypothetical protein LZ012_13880 [Dechloromonas sp. XY25]|uniref:Uncharacterized protein n=1 Tax=Dechloromonas hankyongensis TaxID=2908002 RepID=A0ABS9K4T8_9RHOO|nr:hypothetical protein [Dechloromonas hankyongensis]MCG2578079.1 hypothetical protein [Dechloromonas hankyongensis]